MTLEIANLGKDYGGFEFGPVDLTVDQEVLAVLGPSGSGKTSLLSMIAGVMQPDSGTISLDGQTLVGRPVEDRHVGLVFQEGALFPHMTARENIDYAATNAGRIEELAEILEIRSILDRRPRALSGGERQRVALARTLAADPKLLLLDEPLSSLDAPIRRRLRDELHDLFKSLEIPIIYVTHDQRAATVLGDRITILRDGSIDQVGRPSAILNRPDTEFVARFTGTENVFDAEVSDRDGGSASIRVGDVTLKTHTDHSIGDIVTACIRPSRIQVSTVTKDPSVSHENTLTGTVHRQLNEGDEHRVVINVDRANLTLIATVRVAVFERLAIEPGMKVQMSIPPTAIHVLE